MGENAGQNWGSSFKKTLAGMDRNERAVFMLRYARVWAKYNVRAESGHYGQFKKIFRKRRKVTDEDEFIGEPK